MDSGYHDHFCINFPYCQGPNQIDSSIDLQDKVISPKVVTKPTKKPRSLGPHKLIPKQNRNKKKSRLENKKIGVYFNQYMGYLQIIVTSNHHDIYYTRAKTGTNIYS